MVNSLEDALPTYKENKPKTFPTTSHLVYNFQSKVGLNQNTSLEQYETRNYDNQTTD
jgi:hypothetical protein